MRVDCAGARSAAVLARYPGLEVLSTGHLDEVANLYATLTSDYFLTRFGRAYLRDAFWMRFCDTPECFGYVWRDGSSIVGYTVATLQRDRFLRRVVASAPGRFVRAAVAASIRTPIVVREGFELLWQLRGQRHDRGPTAELLTLGVLPRNIRPALSPTGERVSPALVLMVAAATRMNESGAATFRLYCTAANKLAVSMYRRLQFTERARFQLFGTEKLCFERSTDFGEMV